MKKWRRFSSQKIKNNNEPESLKVENRCFQTVSEKKLIETTKERASSKRKICWKKFLTPFELCDT